MKNNIKRYQWYNFVDNCYFKIAISMLKSVYSIIRLLSEQACFGEKVQNYGRKCSDYRCSATFII